MKRKIYIDSNRFRLILIFGVALLLPVAGLIYVSYIQLRTVERDKMIEATIHRDLRETLAIAEKQFARTTYSLVEDARGRFPSPNANIKEEQEKLDKILTNSSWFTHLFVFNEEKGMTFRTQPSQMNDKDVFKEHENYRDSLMLWLEMEGKMTVETMQKRRQPILFFSSTEIRAQERVFTSTAVFLLPSVSNDRFVIAGAIFDPYYLKGSLFPKMFDDLLSNKVADQSGNPLAIVAYPDETGDGVKPLAMSKGWGKGKPEVIRMLHEPFQGLSLGIRNRWTSSEQLAQTRIHRSLIISGFLSLAIMGGLVLSKHMLSKEMTIVKLKSNFASNISHELCTPLYLIHLYAETLELDRLSTQEKKALYYRTIRKESEQLTSLINNILDK